MLIAMNTPPTSSSTHVTVLIALATAAATAVATLFVVRGYYRKTARDDDRHLEILKQEQNSLPELSGPVASTAEQLAPLVTFLTSLDECRLSRGKPKLDRLNTSFGQWFFETVHNPAAVQLVLDTKSFASIGPLYSAWCKLRIKNDEPIFETSVARKWARHTRASKAKKRILWNHEIHEHPRLGDATLVFWRLHFEPSYNKHEILHSVETICEEFDVTSYVIYELLGPHDLLLRLWLRHPDQPFQSSPLLVPRRAFIAAKFKSLRPSPSRLVRMTEMLGETTTDCDYFRVSRIWRHWWWDGLWWTRTRPSRVLEHGFAADLLDSNEKKAAVVRLVNLYNDGSISFWRVLREPAWWLYKYKRFVRRRKLADGIKFATVVRPNRKDHIRSEDTAQLIERVVRKARWVADRSLYEGTGFDKGQGPAQFVILGRVEHRRFKNIRKEIISPIVAKQEIVMHYAPTLTYVATGPETMRQTYQDGVMHT
jgi:hypothetical protein